jgi:mRNA interferase RelE/StbE
MAWKIEFTPEAQRNLDRLDKQVASRIAKFIVERIAALEDPRSLGEALHGPDLKRYWKYRVGDYRVIAKIEDARISIVVVRIGTRREVYRS